MRLLSAYWIDFREKTRVCLIETMESNLIGQTLYPQIDFREIARQGHYARKL